MYYLCVKIDLVVNTIFYSMYYDIILLGYNVIQSLYIKNEEINYTYDCEKMYSVKKRWSKYNQILHNNIIYYYYLFYTAVCYKRIRTPAAENNNYNIDWHKNYCRRHQLGSVVKFWIWHSSIKWYIIHNILIYYLVIVDNWLELIIDYIQKISILKNCSTKVYELLGLYYVSKLNLQL